MLGWQYLGKQTRQSVKVTDKKTDRREKEQEDEVVMVEVNGGRDDGGSNERGSS